MQDWKLGLLKNHRIAGWIMLGFPLLWWAAALVLGAHPKHWLWPVPLGLGAFVLLQYWCRSQRELLVRELPIAQLLKHRLRTVYPTLSGKDCDLVESALRQFFLACLRSRTKHVAMPSRVVDCLWKEFVAQSDAYRDWCALALGTDLIYQPPEALGPKAKNNDGLRRAWYWACRDEAINPKEPRRLPLLFALDAKLQIENGFRYLAQRDDPPGFGKGAAAAAVGSGVAYYGTDFSDDAFSGDADHFGGVSGYAAGSDGGGDSDGGGGE